MLLKTKETKQIKTETVLDVTSAIIATMGPDGKVVLCDRSGKPYPTKDGVTVAKAMRTGDNTKDLLATMIAECCLRTDQVCGDGTTTTAFLLREIYTRFQHKSNFRNKRLINQYVKEVVETLKQLAVRVNIDSDLLRQVMLTTSNNDERIVNKVLEIYREHPHLPDLTLREATDDEDLVQSNNGCAWPGGFASPEFSNLGNGTPEHFNAYDQYRPILLSGKLDGLGQEKQLTEFIEYTKEYVSNGGTYLIVCRSTEDVSEQALKNMNANLGRTAYKVVTVRAAGSSGVSIMNDIAIVLGAKMHSQLVANHPEYRTAKQYPIVHVSSASLAIVGFNDKHEEQLNTAIKEVNASLNELNVDQRHSAIGKIVESRLRILSGGSITLYVGGLSESEINERKGRFEDVGRVCKSALRNGVLQGCGYSLILASKVLKAKYPDCEIAGDLASVLCQQTQYLMQQDYEDGMVFTNLATGEQAKEPGAIGVWDAALATITALESAASMALLIIDTDSIITNSRLSEVHF
ncbi:heat shock protein 60 family chaperone [Vibrio phage phiKT1019]|nr:heat shock protein 60 family chaperone [Vibrio phage phiKT1019]